MNNEIDDGIRIVVGCDLGTEDEKLMAKRISSSYDISDIKYIDPIVEFLEEESL